MRDYPKVICNEKAARLLRSGHPWVYGEETRGPEETYKNGDIVDVYTEKGRWLGAGFINDAYDLWFDSNSFVAGGGITFGVDTMVGPVEVSLMGSNINSAPVGFINVGFWY